MLGSPETAPVAWDVLPLDREWEESGGGGGRSEKEGKAEGRDGVIMRVK